MPSSSPNLREGNSAAATRAHFLSIIDDEADNCDCDDDNNDDDDGDDDDDDDNNDDDKDDDNKIR